MCVIPLEDDLPESPFAKAAMRDGQPHFQATLSKVSAGLLLSSDATYSLKNLQTLLLLAPADTAGFESKAGSC